MEKITVLLVEDEQTLAMIIKDTLQVLRPPSRRAGGRRDDAPHGRL